MYLLALFLAIAFVGMLTMMAVQLSWWRRGQQVITASQLRARMVYSGVILCVIGMVFVGRFVLQWESVRAEIVYWLGILVIVLLIAIVAAGDWRNVVQMQEKKERQLYREFVKGMRRVILRKKAGEDTPDDRTD
jgi:hypothetical protein